ncbi:MAG: hypothetical protein OEV81_16975 [Betaproteobacteria bacterium]|nr:hypothetical protein [Betaproteobacteria bacterium]MDH5223042.1 hypothetical protein [Betaproteobacteria bacterium]MDH5352448.1 hypothetical protein [Betaproteobacteria bacterium]
MRIAALVLVALPVFAQEQEEVVQRALIERDQRTGEFAARVRGAPLVERQQLENAAARQQLEVRIDPPPELRPYERRKVAREMEAFFLTLPPPVVSIDVLPALQPKGPQPLLDSR